MAQFVITVPYASQNPAAVLARLGELTIEQLDLGQARARGITLVPTAVQALTALGATWTIPFEVTDQFVLHYPTADLQRAKLRDLYKAQVASWMAAIVQWRITL